MLVNWVKCGIETNIEKDFKIIKSTLMLFKLFERAGDSIEEYLQLQQPLEMRGEDVEKDIAMRLVKAGFTLKDRDLDFMIRDCFYPRDSTRLPRFCLETSSDKYSTLLSHHLPLLKNPNGVSPQMKNIPRHVRWFSVSSPPVQRTDALILFRWSIEEN